MSMGLGPLNAIYQARFNKYLHARGIKDTSDQRVWAFLGDGEMDEVESIGAIGLAAREELDNLVFVINCNLQRLDGPVRGNGKVIQELESIFRGAGWNVLKVVWGREWDELLAADGDGALVNLMNTTPDGDFQTYQAESGAYIREHFFGRDPRTRKMVEHLSDEDIWQPQARWARLPQAVCGLQARDRAPRAADRDPGQDHQGLDVGVAVRGAQRDAPDEEAHAGRPQDLPRPVAHPDRGRPARREAAAVLPPGRGQRRHHLPARPAARARWLPARAAAKVEGPRAAAAEGIRGRETWLRQAVGGHDHGVRPLVQRPAQGQGCWPTVRADHPGRGAHVRHGLAVPGAEDLLPARPALHLRRPRADAVVQGVRDRTDPARGHQRGRLGRIVHRRRDVVCDAWRADDPGLHLLLDVRLPAQRRRLSGRPRTRWPAGSCSGRPPAGPR